MIYGLSLQLTVNVAQCLVFLLGRRELEFYSNGKQRLGNYFLLESKCVCSEVIIGRDASRKVHVAQELFNSCQHIW
jgi:hypothetical protein